MTCYLLDVNVLIALLDPAHLQHERAHEWFSAFAFPAWATCPLTENGVLRILGNTRYPSSPGSPAAVLELLGELCTMPGHRFWPDDISLFDRQLIDPPRLLDSSQLTDTYLLALARAHGGKLATFDRHLIPHAVTEGEQFLCTIS